MAEWKKYDGTDEQIAEIENYKGDVAGIFKSGHQTLRSSLFADDFHEYLKCGSITHYLLCNPHPLADMIARQAHTGQPVWVRTYMDSDYAGLPIVDALIQVTTAPDWNIPNAEYRFTPFEEE